MSKERGLGWLAWGALLALAVLIVPACGGSSGSGATRNPGVTGAQWNSTTSGGGGYFPGNGTLWNDPNTAPITGGGGGGGSITYGQADPVFQGTPNANHPVTTGAPQSLTEETALEGYAQAYHSSLQAGGLGGAGGFGGGFGGGIGIPIGNQYYGSNAKIRAVSRGNAQHNTIHVPNEGPPANSLGWRMMIGGINGAASNPVEYLAQGAAMTSQTAWNAMGGAQGYLAGLTMTGWGGAGYWTAGGTRVYVLIMLQLPTGQVP